MMRGQLIKQEPVWYRAVIDNPPLSLPPKSPPARTAYDKKPTAEAQKAYPKNPRPLPIYYIEDDLRRQFFRDHPFEAFRPSTLVEADKIHAERKVDKHEWTRLRQWGRNPSPEEYVSCLHIPSGVLLTLPPT